MQIDDSISLLFFFSFSFGVSILRVCIIDGCYECGVSAHLNPFSMARVQIDIFDSKRILFMGISRNIS